MQYKSKQSTTLFCFDKFCYGIIIFGMALGNSYYDCPNSLAYINVF